MRFRPFFTALAISAAFAALPRAQAPDLDTLLDKAGDYVADYEKNFVGVVAEEAYRQQVRIPGGGRDLRGFPADTTVQKRDLKSDVLLVRAPAGDRWMQFRDVFEVDGKPVRDRAERLAKLFLEPSPSAQQQVQAITAESARYNIGDVARTVNLPMLALTVFEPENLPWFAFNGRRKKDLWELEYREQRGNTMIRTSSGQSMPVRGKLLVEANTGRIVATELAVEEESVRAQIEVTYGLDSSVGLLMPREMREKYVTRRGTTIEGRATYLKFRRYQVTVDQTIKK